MRWVARSAVQLSVRAATAGTPAVAVAQGLGMPQPIYAMISGVIVTDLDPSKSRGLAFPRILGTVIGTVLGGLCAPAAALGAWAVGLAILAAMLLAHVLHNPEAAKLAGYVCAVVMLSHFGDTWSYAWWRCVETMIGIVAAVAMSFVPKLLHDQPPGDFMARASWGRLMRSIEIPRGSHQTDNFERLNKAFGLAKGTPLSERIACGRPRSIKSCSKAVMAGSSRVDSRASSACTIAFSLPLQSP